MVDTRILMVDRPNCNNDALSLCALFLAIKEKTTTAHTETKKPTEISVEKAYLREDVLMHTNRVDAKVNEITIFFFR